MRRVRSSVCLQIRREEACTEPAQMFVVLRVQQVSPSVLQCQAISEAPGVLFRLRVSIKEETCEGQRRFLIYRSGLVQDSRTCDDDLLERLVQRLKTRELKQTSTQR